MNLLDLSADLPIVIEIVDTEEAIESFLGEVSDAIQDGLATVEKVEVPVPPRREVGFSAEGS